MLSDNAQAWILFPMALQMVLTIWVLIRLGVAKSRAYKRNEVDRSRFGLHDDAWPDVVIQANNSLKNQFELPVLFYALSLSLFVLNAGSWLAVSIAALFVGTRCIHAYVHLGSNYVPTRRRAFIAGVLAIVGLTLLNLVAVIRYASA